MSKIIRITNVDSLRSPDPFDTTRYLRDATYVYLYFAEYDVQGNGLWEKGSAWAGTVSVEKLRDLLDEAGLLREIAPSSPCCEVKSTRRR